MGYLIEYRIVENKGRNFFRIFILTVLFFLSFLFLVNKYCPEGAEVMESVFLWVKDSAAVAALDRFSELLAGGEKITYAFSDFFNLLLS